MLTALLQFATAIAGMAIVLGLWFVIQAVVRRRSACHGDRDLLDYLLNGCGGCDNVSCTRSGAKTKGHPSWS